MPRTAGPKTGRKEESLKSPYDFSGFHPLEVIDGHTHFIHPECTGDFDSVLSAVPSPTVHLVCLPNHDGSTQNDIALSYKRQHEGRAYVSGALRYAMVLSDPEKAPADLAAQIHSMKEQGFDGLKMIEGKPEVRKLLPFPFDGPLYADMWAALEQEQLPVVFHVGDPDNFWDPEHCPDWARQKGWDYSDGTYPSKEDLYAEIDTVLSRHPLLKITFAHFYFLSADLARAARFLDDHPSVCFDLAPHIDMYRDFSSSSEAARNFFLRYGDRIIYGTDIDTRVLERGEQGYEFMLSIPWLIRSMLENDGPFEMPGGQQYQGLGLPYEVLNKIYCSNFKRIYGSQPAYLRDGSITENCDPSDG
jgi:predicted TIM-barrel fold metal-dependent hydrolase